MDHDVYDAERDGDAVVRIWREVGWAEPASEIQAANARIYVSAGRGLVARLDGTAECFVGTAPGAMRYLDEDLDMSAVTAVVTSHVARRQGLAGRLTAAAVAADAADGAMVSALGAFDHGFYDRLGFGTGAPVTIRAFDPADLGVPGKPRRPVRLGSEDWEAIHASRVGSMPKHGAMTIRPAAFTRSEIGWNVHSFGLGYRDESGTVTHHLWLHATDLEHGPITVEWAAYRNYDELLELIGLLQGLSDQYDLVRMHEPVGFSLQDLLDRPLRRARVTKASGNEARTEADPSWQVRICDLTACVEAVRVVGEPFAFNLKLTDPVTRMLDDDAPWRGVAGDYRLELGDGGEVEEGIDDSLPTLEASVGAFTRVWLGVLPASSVAATDRLSGPPELLARLDAAMRLPTPDRVWDF